MYSTDLQSLFNILFNLLTKIKQDFPKVLMYIELNLKYNFVVIFKVNIYEFILDPMLLLLYGISSYLLNF